MNIFFTCKNTLVILLQLYRLYVVQSEGKIKRKKANLGNREARSANISIVSRGALPVKKRKLEEGGSRRARGLYPVSKRDWDRENCLSEDSEESDRYELSPRNLEASTRSVYNCILNNAIEFNKVFIKTIYAASLPCRRARGPRQDTGYSTSSSRTSSRQDRLQKRENKKSSSRGGESSRRENSSDEERRGKRAEPKKKKRKRSVEQKESAKSEAEERESPSKGSRRGKARRSGKSELTSVGEKNKEGKSRHHRRGRKDGEEEDEDEGQRRDGENTETEDEEEKAGGRNSSRSSDGRISDRSFGSDSESARR